MIEKMKVSFDFDSTLEHPEMQELARKFIAMKCEVWITTSRTLRRSGMQLINEDVFNVAKSLDIEKNVQFTDFEPKSDYLLGFDLHFDDNETEVREVNESSNPCIAVHYEHIQINKRL